MRDPDSLYGMGVFDENDDPDLAFLPAGLRIAPILGMREFHVRTTVGTKRMNGTKHHIVGI